MNVEAVDVATILTILAKELALPLSKLAKQVGEELAKRGQGLEEGQEQDRIRDILNELAGRKLVKVRGTGGAEEVISITADGVKELERTVKRGVAALFND